MTPTNSVLVTAQTINLVRLLSDITYIFLVMVTLAMFYEEETLISDGSACVDYFVPFTTFRCYYYLKMHSIHFHSLLDMLYEGNK